MISRYYFLCAFVLLSITAIADSTNVITCVRSYVITNKSIEVKIELKNTLSGGFASLTENFPAGYTVTKIKAYKGEHKFKNSQLKIVWDDFPENEIMEITYLLKLNSSVSDTFALIKGNFTAEFLPLSVTSIPVKNGPKTYQLKTNDSPVTAISKGEYNYSDPADEGTYICVQVAALSKSPAKSKIRKSYGYTGGFDVHFEDNLYRITVGRFKTVAEAEALWKELQAEYFDKCFLSAYQNGHKISVNEAETLLK